MKVDLNRRRPSRAEAIMPRRRIRRAGAGPLIRPGVLLAGLLGLAGCMHAQPRGQSEDEADRIDPATAAVRTIGDITTVANAEDVSVAGIGLVTRLEGTGGGVPPGPERAALEEYLKKR